MILKREIERLAETKGLAKITIDKDWVLGHFVDGIYSIPECKDNIIFKGGTCLKKCYFPDYRFSEDLDFTSLSPDFILDKKLLEKITTIVTERTEIPLYIKELKDLLLEDTLVGFSAIVKFWGADHPRNQEPPPPNRWTTSIKIEVILYEKMIFPAKEKTVYHEYSDSLSPAAESVPCYSLEEVLAEKLRSLIQRSYTAPRDFYDIWYLANNVLDLDWSIIVDAFYEKMKFKGLEFTGITQMINVENHKKLKAAWENSLAYQIKADKFPEFDTVMRDLNELLKKNFENDR